MSYSIGIASKGEGNAKFTKWGSPTTGSDVCDVKRCIAEELKKRLISGFFDLVLLKRDKKREWL